MGQNEYKDNDTGSERKALLDYVPESFLEFLEVAGNMARFAVRFFGEVLKPPYEIREVLRQAYYLGYKSIVLVSITGFIIGMVMTLQTLPTLEQFGAESWIPSMIAISIIREIGPVLTGLICAGKVGSGIGAEIGSMKVTEQIDAMAVSGTNPYNYIVVTRVLATTIMVPILVFYADFIAIMGSYVAVNISDEITISLFLRSAMGSVDFVDVIPSTLKTVFFGFTIGMVACYKGYHAEEGTVGVGQAANSSVVVASLLIFIIDLIVVQVTQFFI